MMFSRRLFHTSSSLKKIIPFLLADIGEGITQVQLTQWYIKEGDHVKQFDRLAEVQSDKATVEITSRYDGIVKKLHYQVSDVALVGQPLIDIDSEQVSDEFIIQVEKVSNSKSKVLAAPAVRRIAAEFNIDLGNVKGSGKDGRIMKEDILSSSTKPKESSNHSNVQIVQLSNVQKMMVKSMNSSLSVPLMGYSEEIVVDELMFLRSEILDKRDLKLSFMPFFLKAFSLSLKEFPIINSLFNPTEMTLELHSNHNIGVAMDSKIGLIVPVIKNVQSKSIMEIANDFSRIQATSKDGKPLPSDLVGGTFTVSNIGSIGGTITSPILLAPQTCIVGLGRIQRLPRFDEDDEVIPVNVLQVSVRADHRVIDGATVARFMNYFKKLIENPQLMLIDL